MSDLRPETNAHAVAIGIHVHADPAALYETVASVRAHSRAAEVLLLPDGPDAETEAACCAVGLRSLPTRLPMGPPACFNRLVQATTAPVIVLLESGAIASSGWLDFLLRALYADPHNGLAGPSTNRAWNDQGAFPRARGTLPDIEDTALHAALQFGDTTRTLEPLYSLADFCYAVRREVTDAIGAADEGYGLGPCWEMDYNVRAARAGFRGVWARGAYVFRRPFSARRERTERTGFEASKRHYQDRFCAQRLRGERATYEPHCRGDACEHFAPASLIQINLPLPPFPTAELIAPALPAQTALIVSCIMPTRDRADFVMQSVSYFQRQTYAARELIIVDDGTDDLEARLPRDERVRYLRVEPGLSIGEKRNRACAIARGEIIAQWDDDDWYAPDRLHAQTAPILTGSADITGFNAGIFFDVPSWKFWRCTHELHSRLFQGDVHGGTLVYRRSVWQELARYPNASLAEDAAFLLRALRRGARLARLPASELFIYVRHGSNSWSLQFGRGADRDMWFAVDEPACLAADRRFYLGDRKIEDAAEPPNMSRNTMATPPTAADIRCGGGPPRARDQQFASTSAPVASTSARGQRAARRPLVSCIMPTADRAAFVPRALEYFARQSYPERELIVLDDGLESVDALMPRDARVRYIRLPAKRDIGTKRNDSCAAARGDIIVHWDDDDWSAEWRIEYQVDALRNAPPNAVCGLSNVVFYDVAARRALEYRYPSTLRPWIAGGTFCFRRALWERQPFPALREGEDTRFLWSLSGARVVPLEDNTFYVAMIHGANTSAKRTTEPRWRSADAQHVRERLGGDIGFYDSLA